ncbi:hypothetical protein [Halobacillus litoralis]|uniref:hypothetical protein n=1 Tax=Halobacillus litoralis TaxID=45668 RepID=UPI001CFEA6EF|nr:hypothetical protein [Halobacillus litoralis]
MTNKQMVFVQAAMVFLYLFLVSIIHVKLLEQASGALRLYPYIVFGQSAYIPVGCLLGLQHIAAVWKGEKRVRWSMRTWFFVVFPFLYLLLIPYIIPLNSLLPVVMITNPSISPVIQVVFGYILVSTMKEK